LVNTVLNLTLLGENAEILLWVLLLSMLEQFFVCLVFVLMRNAPVGGKYPLSLHPPVFLGHPGLRFSISMVKQRSTFCQKRYTASKIHYISPF